MITFKIISHITCALRTRVVQWVR